MEDRRPSTNSQDTAVNNPTVHNKERTGRKPWYRNYYLFMVRVPVGIFSVIVLGILVNHHMKRKAVTCAEDADDLCRRIAKSGEPWWILGMVAAVASVALTLFELGCQFIYPHFAPKGRLIIFFDVDIIGLCCVSAALLGTTWGISSSKIDDLAACFALIFLMIATHLIMAIGGACVWCRRREKASPPDEHTRDINLASWGQSNRV